MPLKPRRPHRPGRISQPRHPRRKPHCTAPPCLPMLPATKPADTEFARIPGRIAMRTHRLMGYAAAAAIMAAGVQALAQAPAPTPANPWYMAAPFPEASEEVLAATANNKL